MGVYGRRWSGHEAVELGQESGASLVRADGKAMGRVLMMDWLLVVVVSPFPILAGKRRVLNGSMRPGLYIDGRGRYAGLVHDGLTASFGHVRWVVVPGNRGRGLAHSQNEERRLGVP